MKLHCKVSDCYSSSKMPDVKLFYFPWKKECISSSSVSTSAKQNISTPIQPKKSTSSEKRMLLKRSNQVTVSMSSPVTTPDPVGAKITSLSIPSQLPHATLSIPSQYINHLPITSTKPDLSTSFQSEKLEISTSRLQLKVTCYCKVAGCMSSNRMPDVRLFSFPRKKELCERWIEFTGNADLKDRWSRNGKISRNRIRICSRHFLKTDFMNSRMERLNRGTVPSINGPDTSPNLLDGENTPLSISSQLPCTPISTTSRFPGRILITSNKLDMPNCFLPKPLKISSSREGLKRKYHCRVSCCNSSNELPDCKLFHFPVRQELCKRWIEFTGNADLKNRWSKNGSILRSYNTICSRHFLESDFTDSWKKRLKRGVVPSINGPDSFPDRLDGKITPPIIPSQLPCAHLPTHDQQPDSLPTTSAEHNLPTPIQPKKITSSEKRMLLRRSNQVTVPSMSSPVTSPDPVGAKITSLSISSQLPCTPLSIPSQYINHLPITLTKPDLSTPFQPRTLMSSQKRMSLSKFGMSGCAQMEKNLNSYRNEAKKECKRLKAIYEGLKANYQKAKD